MSETQAPKPETTPSSTRAPERKQWFRTNNDPKIIRRHRFIAGTVATAILSAGGIAIAEIANNNHSDDKNKTEISAPQFEKDLDYAKNPKRKIVVTKELSEDLKINKQIEKQLKSKLGDDLIIPEVDINRLTHITVGLNHEKDFTKEKHYDGLSDDAAIISTTLAELPPEQLPLNTVSEKLKKEALDTAAKVNSIDLVTTDSQQDHDTAAAVIHLINGFDKANQLQTITEAWEMALKQDLQDDQEQGQSQWQSRIKLGDNKNVWGAIEKTLEDRTKSPATVPETNAAWRLTQAVNKAGYDWRHMTSTDEYTAWNDDMIEAFAKTATLNQDQVQQLPKDLQKAAQAIIALNHSDPQSSRDKIQEENKAALDAVNDVLEKHKPKELIEIFSNLLDTAPTADSHEKVHFPPEIDQGAIKKAENLGILTEVTFRASDKTIWDKAAADIQKATGQSQISPAMVNPVSRINEGFNAIDPHKMHDEDKIVTLTPEASVAVSALANLPLEKMDMLPPEGVALIKQIQELNNSPEHNTHSRKENLQAAQTVAMIAEMFPDPQQFADLQELLKAQHVDLKKVQKIFQDAIKEIPPEILEKMPKITFSEAVPDHQWESALVQTSFDEQNPDFSGNDGEINPSSSDTQDADYEQETTHVLQELAQIRTDYQAGDDDETAQDSDHAPNMSVLAKDHKDIEALVAGGIGLAPVALRRGRLQRFIHGVKERFTKFKAKLRRKKYSS